MNIKYFYITDQIEKGKTEVEFCPTDEMIADFMTKALHGSKFERFKKMIMNQYDQYKQIYVKERMRKDETREEMKYMR